MLETCSAPPPVILRGKENGIFLQSESTHRRAAFRSLYMTCQSTNWLLLRKADIMKSKNRDSKKMMKAMQHASNGDVLAGKARTPDGLPAHIYTKEETAHLYPATFVLEFPPFIKTETGVEDICVSISEFLEVFLKCYDLNPEASKAYKRALKKFYPLVGANELFDLAG